MRTPILLCLLLLPSCLGARPKPETGAFENPYASPRSSHGLEPGQVIIQGIVGASQFDEVQRSGGDNPAQGGSADGLKQMPLIGGNWQTVMGGKRLDYGLEGGFSLGFRSDGGVVVLGGGTGTAAVRIDLYLLDLYGGPFVSLPIGDKLRVYGAIGPVMQFASFHQERDDNGPHFNDVGSGFGLGWYTRLGVEMALGQGMMIGLGGRWVDSNVNLSDGLGDLDIKGAQVFLTVSTGF